VSFFEVSFTYLYRRKTSNNNETKMPVIASASFIPLSLISINFKNENEKPTSDAKPTKDNIV
jgi:hypothetical protein